MTFGRVPLCVFPKDAEAGTIDSIECNRALSGRVTAMDQHSPMSQYVQDQGHVTIRRTESAGGHAVLIMEVHGEGTSNTFAGCLRQIKADGYIVGVTRFVMDIRRWYPVVNSDGAKENLRLMASGGNGEYWLHYVTADRFFYQTAGFIEILGQVIGVSAHIGVFDTLDEALDMFPD
jgi:hypothetical protein